MRHDLSPDLWRALVLLHHRLLEGAAMVATASLVGFTLGLRLLRRADPEELKERACDRETGGLSEPTPTTREDVATSMADLRRSREGE